MWTQEDEQRVIDDTFGGDVSSYLADLRRGRKTILQWQDVVAEATILPELQISGQEFIKELLGFLPPDYLLLPQEPFIRALIQQYRNGGLIFDELIAQAGKHLKPLRNEFVGDDACLNYSRAMYRKYFEYLPELTDTTKDRLTRFLGYEPALEHSLHAELKLRQCLATDHFTPNLSRADIQSITIIKYRENLLTEGKAAADHSPLVAMDLTMQFVKQIVYIPT